MAFKGEKTVFKTNRTIFLKLKHSYTYTQATILNKKIENFIDSGGRTPLADAVDVQNMEIVRFLVENGADVNIHDRNGGTAFHETIIRKYTKTFNYFLDNATMGYCGSKTHRQET